MIRVKFGMVLNHRTANTIIGESENSAGLVGPLATDVNCNPTARLLVLNSVLTKALKGFKENEVILSNFGEPRFPNANHTCLSEVESPKHWQVHDFPK